MLRSKSFVGPERLGVFSLLYGWAKEGRHFPILGRGNNKYQLLDVDDLCEAIFLSMTKDRQTVNDAFNIGAKNFSTIREEYQAVLNKAGFGKKIISIPAGPAVAILKILEFMRLSPLYQWIYETIDRDSFVSIEKPEKKLGDAPKYSNTDALIRNFNWYAEQSDKYKGCAGISHHLPWNQGALKVLKLFF